MGNHFGMFLVHSIISARCLKHGKGIWGLCEPQDWTLSILMWNGRSTIRKTGTTLSKGKRIWNDLSNWLNRKICMSSFVLDLIFALSGIMWVFVFLENKNPKQTTLIYRVACLTGCSGSIQISSFEQAMRTTRGKFLYGTPRWWRKCNDTCMEMAVPSLWFRWVLSAHRTCLGYSSGYHEW